MFSRSIKRPEQSRRSELGRYAAAQKHVEIVTFILPQLRRFEAGLNQQRAELFWCVFVGILGVDSLALRELPHRATHIHADRLPRFEVHFCAAHSGVAEAWVLPVFCVEIGA